MNRIQEQEKLITKYQHSYYTNEAEISDEEEPHSWFVGFSENPSCPVAIVVVVENGGWGSSSALPIASSVMDSAYKLLS